MRSWYFIKNALANLGCLPNSAITAAMPTFILGISSNNSPNFPRLLAYQPICALIKVVLGCFLNILCCSSIICSQGAGSVSLRFLLGCVLSSNQRSLSPSKSSQKDLGSAECINTGIPNSAQVSQMGSNRGSSTGMRLPSTSLSFIPNPLYTFNPLAPFFTSSFNCATVFSVQPSPPTPLKLTFANTTKRLG